MSPDLRRIYRRLRYGDSIVVVSGLPRSGTSMAMKMLEAGGMSLVTDGIRTANEDNPKGYFEFEPVKELDKQKDKSWLGQARGKVIKIISFLLKDLPSTNNYKILFINRNLYEVVASQNKMLVRRGESTDMNDARALEVFEEHLSRVRSLLEHRSDFEVLEIHYTKVLENPLEQARRIDRFLDGRLDTEKMAGAVDESLYRNRRP
jgi:hypothetical protein